MPHLASDEGHITIFPSAYDSIGQGSWIWSVNQQFIHILAGVFYNSSNANNDEISYKIELSAGTYTLNILTTLGESRGIMKWYIDDIEVASFDNYSASPTFNVVKQQIGIFIPTIGLKTLKLKVVGKNPLATGYCAFLQNISLWRTA